MLSNCVHTYVLQNFLYHGDGADKAKDVLSELIKSIKINSHEAFVIDKPIPLTLDSKIAPVEWYYNLFTDKKGLQSALAKHNSDFPTKVFLVFNTIASITLGNASKELVSFKVVNKKDVDACISNVLRQP